MYMEEILLRICPLQKNIFTLLIYFHLRTFFACCISMENRFLYNCLIFKWLSLRSDKKKSEEK